MTVRSTEASSAALNGDNALLNGGSFVFTDGDLGTGNVLATYTLQNPAHSTSTDGTSACAGLPAYVTPTRSGTIAGWAAKTSGNATRLTGHLSEITISSPVLTLGIPFLFSGWVATQGAGT
jgi:hypothetical protein